MQRKNSILISSKPKLRFDRKRGAFAMVLAVGVIILISTIMIFSLNSTATSSKKTVDLFLYEQAELHTKSAIEYALHKIANEGCQDNLTIDSLDNVYDIDISMQYIFNSDVAGCTEYINNIQTPEQNGSVLMDVVVTIPTDITGTEPIRFFRRTIQKL